MNSKIHLEALVDLGASDNFMNWDFTILCENSLDLVETIGGFLLSLGLVTHQTIPLTVVSLRGHQDTHQFGLILFPHSVVIRSALTHCT